VRKLNTKCSSRQSRIEIRLDVEIHSDVERRQQNSKGKSRGKECKRQRFCIIDYLNQGRRVLHSSSIGVYEGFGFQSHLPLLLSLSFHIVQASGQRICKSATHVARKSSRVSFHSGANGKGIRSTPTVCIITTNTFSTTAALSDARHPPHAASGFI
jgi:hypothetical protein